jgi:hypothetical protein
VQWGVSEGSCAPSSSAKSCSSLSWLPSRAWSCANSPAPRGAPRASRVASRLAGRPVAPRWRTSSTTEQKLARHRGALLTGQEPRRLLPPADPRVQVGPRTSRPARAVLTGLSEEMAVAARRAPGSATYAPLSLKGRSDKAVPYPKWRALVRGHARARPRGAPAKCAGAQLPLKARALDVRSYVPLHPRILASGSAAARLGRQPRTKGPGTRLAARPRSAARLAPGPRRASRRSR